MYFQIKQILFFTNQIIIPQRSRKYTILQVSYLGKHNFATSSGMSFFIDIRVYLFTNYFFLSLQNKLNFNASRHHLKSQ